MEEKNTDQNPSDNAGSQPNPQVISPAPTQNTTPPVTPDPAEIPIEVVSPTPPPQKEVVAELTLDEKLEAARRAMEGPNRTADRLSDEKEKEIKNLLDEVQGEMEKVSKEKEVFELAWVDLNEKRKTMKAEVDPIIKEEKKLEGEEIILEGNEARSALPQTKHEVEEKRWGVQQQRRQKEEAKWTIEQRIIALDAEIKTNTENYQKLLDTEEKLRERLETLEKGASI